MKYLGKATVAGLCVLAIAACTACDPTAGQGKSGKTKTVKVLTDGTRLTKAKYGKYHVTSRNTSCKWYVLGPGGNKKIAGGGIHDKLIVSVGQVGGIVHMNDACGALST